MGAMESSKSALSSGREGADRVWPVALFTSVYLVGALITAVQVSNYEFLLYIGVVVLMMGVELYNEIAQKETRKIGASFHLTC